MASHFRYVALLDWDRPIENPLMVLRIHGSQEEAYVPAKGWEPADPVCRDWYENVAITEDHALRLLPELAPAGELEDPYPHALTRDAAEGFGTQWFHYAVETPEHPLDDPLTVTRLHHPSRSEHMFTSNLMWEKAPITGRRVRIAEPARRDLEKLLVDRAFGGAEVRHYAVVNAFQPDIDEPAAIVREVRGKDERLTGSGNWEPTSTIFSIRNGFGHGRLVPLTDQEEAARHVDRWRPHPERARTRYFAWKDAHGQPVEVKRVQDDDGALRDESYVDGVWGGPTVRTFLDEKGRVEIDQQTAERFGESMDRRGTPGDTFNERCAYFAIMGRQYDDVSDARALVCSAGSSESVLDLRIDRWRRSTILYEIRSARDDSYAVPISAEVAARLRLVLRDRFAAGEAGTAPEPPRPLGAWKGLGKVTVPLLDAEDLDSLRRAGDPLADAAVAEVYRLGAVERVNDLLGRLNRTGDKVPRDLPPLLRRYFEESAALPGWADRAVLGRAGDLWKRLGLHLATVLCFHSLPIRYAAAPSLRHTSRGLESTWLLIDVLAGKGLLGRRGEGLRTVQKVRLRHAATRHLGSHGDGLLANQEDMAAIAATLSVGLVEGLRRVYADETRRDRDDLFHIWSVVGHLLGVDQRLLPTAYDDAVALADTLWRRGRVESAEGRELAAALERRFRAAVPRELGGLFPSLIDTFCKRDLAGLLGVAPVDPGAWNGLAESAMPALGLPAGSRPDDRTWTSTVSRCVGEALLRADAEEDLSLPLPPGAPSS